MAVLSLAEALAQVPDPRDPRGVRHPLVAILSLAVVAILAGHHGPQAIAKFARDRGAALGVVLSRVPPAAAPQVTAHFDAMLEANGLTDMQRFVIAETVSSTWLSLRSSRPDGAKIIFSATAKLGGISSALRAFMSEPPRPPVPVADCPKPGNAREIPPGWQDRCLL